MAGDEIVSVALTRTQLAQLRAMVFRELHQDAENLAEYAHQAHGSGGRMAGEDAATGYRMVSESAPLLNPLGWSVDGDIELIRQDESQRRGVA